MSTEPPSENPRAPKPISIGGGFLFVYAALAVAFAATAAYLIVVRHAPLTSPQVAVSGLGALWFFFRTVMSLTPRNRP